MGFSLSRELLRSASRIAIAAAAAGLLAGCSGAGTYAGGSDDSSAVALNAIEPEGQDFVGGAAYWGAKYQANRDDMTAGMNFGRNLRMMGGARQAVAVLKDVVMKTPDDPRVLSEYGKALTAAGRVQDALPFLSRASQMDGNDWTIISAYGVALDQTGNHAGARENYQAALKLSPANPAVESNMAMSYVIDGRIDEAELILRRLVARPDASAQMRQNLAMVAAIKGNASEAEQLGREDLPPSDVTNNLALLQQLDARNVPINVQPLAPPTPATTPSQTAPAGSAPAHAPMAPIGENSENLKLKASAAVPTQQPSTTAPTPAAPTTPAPAFAAQAPSVPKASPYTMAPIADPEDVKPAQATAAAKPLAPKQTTPSQPAQPAIKPTPQPAPTAAQATPATAPTAVTTEKAASAAPRPVLRQSYDVYRRPSHVEVANAAQ